MVQIADIISFFDHWAPPSIAESWDTTGLVTGSSDAPVETVIVTLDITEQTIDKARTLSSPFIIAHHPPIFTPLSTLSGTGRTVSLARELIRHDIASFTAHTNLDQAPGGVSAALGELLGLTGLQPLSPGQCQLVKFVTFTPPEYTDTIREVASRAGAGAIGDYTMCSFTNHGTGTFLPAKEANPFRGTHGELAQEPEDRIEMIVPEPYTMDVIRAVKDVHPYEEMAYDVIPLSLHMPSFGYGAVGALPEPMPRDKFLKLVGTCLDLDILSVSNGKKDVVSLVAVMGGSGSKLVAEALRAGADAFVTGEIGHHTFIDYGSDILLVDATHESTERPVLHTIQSRLSHAFQGLTVVVDETPSPCRAIHLSSHT